MNHKNKMSSNGFSSPEGISIRDYLDDKLENLEKSIDIRFESVARTTEAALSSADKATLKAESAAEKRFEGLNEFRGQQKDIIETFARRTEFRLVVDRLEQDIRNLQLARAKMEGKASAASVYIGYIIALTGIVIGVISLLTK